MKLANLISGLTPEQSEEVLKIAVSQLPQGVRIWLFGSRVTGTFRRYSDVDLLLEARPDGSIDDEQLRHFRQALEDSELPYKFDVVREEDLAESFRARVTAERLLLLG